jgi:hypothetical protein
VGGNISEKMLAFKILLRSLMPVKAGFAPVLTINDFKVERSV